MNKLMAILAVGVVALCVMTLHPPVTVQAQTSSLPLGTFVPSTEPSFPCSQALNGSLFLAGMTCLDGTINCPNTQSIGITYGWSIPSGSITGTIVMFSGGNGKTPSEYADDNLAYASTYQTNYVVVQLEYASAWEDPNNGPGGSILNAACRPTTFLSWVNSNSLLHPMGKAMCAQGGSAGSGAISYSLAWYGASSYLKNVELISGPVFSKIDQGCTYPDALNMTICPAGQYGCTAKTNTWANYVIYVGDYAKGVSNWTGLPLCGRSGVNSSDYPTWAAMSIVDGTSGTVTPTFNYPTTTMHSWLCSTYSGCDDGQCPNNSASQGNYYYQQFSSMGPHPESFGLTGVTQCRQEEGIGAGYDPDTGLKAPQAIANDMQTKCQ